MDYPITDIHIEKFKKVLKKDYKKHFRSLMCLDVDIKGSIPKPTDDIKPFGIFKIMEERNK